MHSKLFISTFVYTVLYDMQFCWQKVSWQKLKSFEKGKDVQVLLITTDVSILQYLTWPVLHLAKTLIIKKAVTLISKKVVYNWSYEENFKPIFFYEKILSVKKSIKRKTSNFYPLRSLCAQKIVAFVVFLFAFFCFISRGFFCECFLRLKSFRKKK